MPNMSRMIGNIKYKGGIIVGSFYENKMSKNTLMGTYIDNTFTGTINFKTLGSLACEGIFMKDSLVIKVFMNDTNSDTLFLKLKKNNNSTILNIDDFFGEQIG